MLANPLSEDQSAMRTTLLGSLLDVASRNLARDADAVALFESGQVYLNSPPTGLKRPNDGRMRPIDPLAGSFVGERDAPFAEPHRVAALAVGPLVEKSWRGGGEPADFFALKGVLEALAGRLGVELSFAATAEPFLHPGRTAAVEIDGAPIGWLGEIHPLVAREWDLEAAVGFEVDAAALIGASSLGEETYEDVTAFPAAQQDLAVVVSTDVSAAEVRSAVLAGGGEMLRQASVFDLYEGEQVGEGRKSLGLRLVFRSSERTLTDEEVVVLRAKIVELLCDLGGELRFGTP
jgi:phenylalanyl-tRNA synthetase beta chain